jgi:hypothetical protein|uniref:Uncharacterized protein n=1 Tax=viral metagenome TaxID=1070528 RepID=A0A6C0IYG3_9ZZZZ
MNHVYDINGDYYPCNSKKVTTFKNGKTNNRVVENFGMGIANKTKITNDTLVKNTKEIEKNINQSAVVAGVTKLLGAVLNEVANENNAELSQMIALSNEIDISNIVADEDFNFAGINQDATSDANSNIKAQQNIKTKVTTDITKKIKSTVKKIFDEIKDSKISNEGVDKSSSSIGGTIASLGKSVAGAAEKILSMQIANSTDSTTNNKAINELKDKMKLDDSFTMKKDKSVSDTINNKLSSKNMAKCAKDTKQANKFKLDKIKVGGSVKIGTLSQRASVKAVLSCAFNQTVLSEIATKIVSDIDENIINMKKSADLYAEKNKSLSTSGDVYAAGVAGKQLLEGVGDASVGIGKGVSSAAEGVGKGVSTAAEGVGTGIGSALSGMVMPLVAGAIAMVIFGVVYTMVKKGGMPSMEGDDE